MPGVMVQAALRRAISQVRYLRPVPPAGADPLTAAVYRQLESDFGMLAPPVALHAASPRLLAACWLMLRESLIADGGTSRATREAVAAAVSAGNACPYCVTVHGATGQALANRTRATAAPAAHTDIIDWVALAGVRDTAVRPPAEAVAAARLIGVLTTFHYLNRVVNVFLGRSPLPDALPTALASPASQLLGRFAAAAADRRQPAGTSLRLLPAAVARSRPAWAESDPILGEAFARAGAAVELAAAEVPISVRQLLTELLNRWDGRQPGLDPRWLDEPLAGLPAADRPAGRLALLTAFASYRVEERQVEDFRRTRPGDPALLGLVSWASLATALQIAGWIPVDTGGSAEHRGNA